jgi:hypothetical protein
MRAEWIDTIFEKAEHGSKSSQNRGRRPLFGAVAEEAPQRAERFREAETRREKVTLTTRRSDLVWSGQDALNPETGLSRTTIASG